MIDDRKKEWWYDGSLGRTGCPRVRKRQGKQNNLELLRFRLSVEGCGNPTMKSVVRERNLGVVKSRVVAGQHTTPFRLLLGTMVVLWPSVDKPSSPTPRALNTLPPTCFHCHVFIISVRQISQVRLLLYPLCKSSRDPRDPKVWSCVFLELVWGTAGIYPATLPFQPQQ